jgi:hypothetical protein
LLILPHSNCKASKGWAQIGTPLLVALFRPSAFFIPYGKSFFSVNPSAECGINLFPAIIHQLFSLLHNEVTIEKFWTAETVSRERGEFFIVWFENTGWL